MKTSLGIALVLIFAITPAVFADDTAAPTSADNCQALADQAANDASADIQGCRKAYDSADDCCANPNSCSSGMFGGGDLGGSADVLVVATRIVGEPLDLCRATGRRGADSGGIPDQHGSSARQDVCSVGARPDAVARGDPTALRVR